MADVDLVGIDVCLVCIGVAGRILCFELEYEVPYVADIDLGFNFVGREDCAFKDSI